MESTSKKISIVVPIFNEEENIDKLYRALTSVAISLKHFDDYEIVAVNDGSRDRSQEKLEALCAQDSRIKIVSFTRNFGHEAATTAGLCHALGDAVAIFDADLQDPPSLLLEFEKEAAKGYDIVYAQREKRVNETFFKKLTSKLFYCFFRWITKLDMPRDVGDCCFLSRRAVESFKYLSERSLFVRGMIYWSGLPKKGILFVRQKRAAGTTKYNYSKLSRFAIDNIILFSTTPLYFIFALSLFFVLASGLGIIFSLIFSTSKIVSFMFFHISSLMLCSLGMIGLYVGKIFEETKGRPRYIVDKVVNFDVKNYHSSKITSEETEKTC